MAPAFETFIRPARARPQLWRLGVGLVVCSVVYAGVALAIVGLVWVLRRAGLPLPDISDMNVEDPITLLVILATFLGMATGPMVAARLLHGRGAASLFGRGPRVLRDFVAAFLVIGVVYAINITVWSFFYDAQPGLNVRHWLLLLPLTLLGLLIQTGAEELFFRGYLQQQLAARFRSPIAWAILPALLFGAAHYAPEMGDTAWLVVGVTAIFGLLAADLTATTGSLGAAWGFHFGNNLFALAILATPGSLSGLGLMQTPYSIEDVNALRGILVIDIAAMLLAWILIRRITGAR